MITPRSALKFDLFADASRKRKRKRKIDEVGDTLQVIAQHIDFGELAALVDGLVARADGRKGRRPAYTTEKATSHNPWKFRFRCRKSLAFLGRGTQLRAGHRCHAGAGTMPAHRQGRQGAPGARQGP